MTQPPVVTTAAQADRERLLQTLVAGFSSDPMMRWMLPSAADYLRVAGAIFDAFGGHAFDTGSAYAANDGEALALWVPPGYEGGGDDEAMGELMLSVMSEALLGEVMLVIEDMSSYHPKEPHWYLPLIAADPAHQGKGLGSALMKHALARCDADGVPAFLESTNAQNVSLYERHGFEVVAEVQHGSSPVIRPMVRLAQ